ncbi:MAG: DUF4956 domain-containing protein [Chloroflexi bacterium CFX6]|nr:DUF4956 domain-containing protein [Chloroflexi bacterium CFX6]
MDQTILDNVTRPELTPAMILVSLGLAFGLAFLWATVYRRTHTGVAGALSIIRFRTVIKDTKDMTFLFQSVAIGLCAGAGAWIIALIGTGLVAAVVVALHAIGYGALGSADYVLVFRSREADPWARLSQEARDLVAWKQLRGATDIGDDFEYTYSIRLAPKVAPERVVTALRGDVAREVTLITPENHLEL